MIHIQWKDRYNINYKEIDEQHRGLLVILNEINDLLGVDPDAEQIAGIFHRLCQYALEHFATEEQYMKAVGFPGLEAHRAEHTAFVHQLLGLNQKYDSPSTKMLEETLEFVKDWYLNHIMRSDQNYVPSFKAFHASAEKKGVILDFGSVLGTLDEGPFLETVSALCGKAPGNLAALIGASSDLNRAFESGAMLPDAYLQQAENRCGSTLDGAAFRQAYSQAFKPSDDIQAMIRTLKANHKVALLAQTSPWRYEDVIRTLEIFPLLDAVTLSYELGEMKPSPALLDDAVAKLGLMAEECVYVDGKGANALAATGHLLHGLAFSTHEALLTGLRRLKIQV
jgi:hemerythrin-like metal-binding protein